MYHAGELRPNRFIGSQQGTQLHGPPAFLFDIGTAGGDYGLGHGPDESRVEVDAVQNNREIVSNAERIVRVDGRSVNGTGIYRRGGRSGNQKRTAIQSHDDSACDVVKSPML